MYQFSSKKGSCAELFHEEELVNLKSKANFKTLGRRLGSNMKTVAQAIEKLDLDQIRDIQNGKNVSIIIKGNSIELSPEDVLIQREEKKGLLVETDNLMTVALDTELNNDLIQEGFAREFVNKIQNMRKEMNLNVMDRILISYQASAKLNKALENYSDFICKETLASNMKIQNVSNSTKWDLNGEPCKIKLKHEI